MANFKETFLLRSFLMFKIPLLAFLRPSIVENSDSVCEVKIPLSRRSKNHLNCMYFGALTSGADCVGGLVALNCIRKKGNKVSMLFKDLKADFKKRAEGDVVFRCEQNKEIEEFVDQVMKSDQRMEMPIKVSATVPSISEDVVAEFALTLSLKRR